MTLKQLQNRIRGLPPHTQNEIVRAYGEMKKALEKAANENEYLKFEVTQLNGELAGFSKRGME